MDIARISEILVECLGNEGEDDVEVVDVWMPIALKTKQVKKHEAEMIKLLEEWPSASWGQPIPPLGSEISYIQAGAVLDDQQRAFMLFAFGKLVEWWQVMEPGSMFGMAKNDPRAQQMVGMGLVSIMGYAPAKVVD